MSSPTVIVETYLHSDDFERRTSMKTSELVSVLVTVPAYPP